MEGAGSHITRHLGAYHDPAEMKIVLVMERACMSLHQYCTMQPCFQVEDASMLHFAHGLCGALDFLGRHSLLHRDLKPANVIVDVLR